jgi:thiaminase
MTSIKLTDHLLSISTNPTYDEATRHSFLTEAGSGTLPLPRLALWLSQDRIYAAHAYPRFIGALISRIPFQQADAITSPREQQNQRILQALVKCLDHVVREVDFFRDTSETFGISMEGWIERKGTRDYTAEMFRMASSGLFEALVFLWAMEQVWSLLAELFSIIVIPTFLEILMLCCRFTSMRGVT